MTKKLSIQIEESQESVSDRKAEMFAKDVFKSLNIPDVDKDGFVTGVFTGFELIPASGEIKTTRNGKVWTDKRDQLKFTFTIPFVDSGDQDVYFWTGTSVDGVKDDDKFSKLVTWFIAIGALDEKQLHPKFKAKEGSMMQVIQSVFEKKFRFKLEQKGRIWNPVISSFELVDEDTES